MVLGNIYGDELKKYEQAADEYKLAINLNPEHTRAHLGLGAAEVMTAMSILGGRPLDELKREDRGKTISTARQATEHIRKAIYELKFDHPFGYLFLAMALEYQFLFRDAEKSLGDYLNRVKELESQLASLAKSKTCDYGFATLYANYYRFVGGLYLQERALEADYQRQNELLNKAEESYKQVQRLKADDAEAYNSLGQIYLLQGKYNEAIKQYEEALSRQTNESNKARDYAHLGYAYSAVGRSQEAVDYLNKAIKIAPDRPDLYLILESIYAKQGKYDEAIAALRKSMWYEQPPTAHSYNFLAGLYLARARQKGGEPDYEEAIKLAGEALRINGTFASAYLTLGNIYRYYKNGTKTEEALANYQLARQYDPKNATIYNNIADLYFVRHNYDAAIGYFQDALKLKPNWPDVHVALGLAYREKHDDAKAVEQLEEATKQNDKYLDAYTLWADIYDQQKNYGKAIDVLLKAIGNLPTEWIPYKEMARIYTHAHRNKEAIDYYEQAIDRMKPDDWFRELWGCRIVSLRGEYANAIGCFQKIKPPGSADPGQVPYEIGLVHVASGNKTAAQAKYEQLMRLSSSLADNLKRQISDMK